MFPVILVTNAKYPDFVGNNPFTILLPELFGDKLIASLDKILLTSRELISILLVRRRVEHGTNSLKLVIFHAVPITLLVSTFIACIFNP